MGTRFVFSLAMGVFGYPTGVAAVFPKLIALGGGLGGGFWGIMLAVFITRYLGHHWIGRVDFGNRPILNTTMSAFLTSVLLVMIALAIFGERTGIGAILEVLLRT